MYKCSAFKRQFSESLSLSDLSTGTYVVKCLSKEGEELDIIRIVKL